MILTENPMKRSPGMAAWHVKLAVGPIGGQDDAVQRSLGLWKAMTLEGDDAGMR
jgi:hypothetical protein